MKYGPEFSSRVGSLAVLIEKGESACGDQKLPSIEGDGVHGPLAVSHGSFDRYFVVLDAVEGNAPFGRDRFQKGRYGSLNCFFSGGII